MLPTADVLYVCDGRFWKVHIERIRAGFTGERWTQDHAAAREHSLHYVRLIAPERGKPATGLCKEPDAIHSGGNAGYQAIGLAYLFGAKRIVLVGYDMQRGPEDKDRAHWHADHPLPLSNGHPRAWRKHFDPLAADLKAAGVNVINASRETALTAFPRATLEEALQ